MPGSKRQSRRPRNRRETMHEIDFTQAEEHGWKIEPVFKAEKGRRRPPGTADEVLSNIGRHIEQERVREESLERTRKQAEAAPVDRFVLRIERLYEEALRRLRAYRDLSGQSAALEDDDYSERARLHPRVMRELDRDQEAPRSDRRQCGSRR
jgi:hypothetical protein